MRMLFVHGAGGYVDDRPIADGLGELLGATVDMPHIPDDDMSYEAWAAVVRRALLDRPDYVIGHSFGASILLRVLASRSVPSRSVPSATLLAMPDWSPAGWDVADYAYSAPEPSAALTLHHCRDDDVVPFAHVGLHASALPSARVYSHDHGGHQFEGVLDAVADSVRL